MPIRWRRQAWRNAGRNSARDFWAWQANLALRRDFPIREGPRLQFRAEAFNVLNRSNFTNINSFLASGPYNPTKRIWLWSCRNTLNQQLGGNSLYNIGGPRSLQLALKLQF